MRNKEKTPDTISIRLKRDSDVERFREIRDEKMGEAENIETLRELMDFYEFEEELEEIRDATSAGSLKALMRKMVDTYKRESPAYRFSGRTSRGTGSQRTASGSLPV